MPPIPLPSLPAVQPEWRDPFPKLDLHGGYLGDGYPLCADLPPRAFLLAGARYSYRGATMTADMALSFDGTALVLADNSSRLFQALCNRATTSATAAADDGDDAGGGSSGGRCQLRSELSLPEELPCHGDECEADAPRLLQLRDGSGNGNGNETATVAYFEWVRPACVELAFYADATVVSLVSGSKSHEACADPQLAVAGSCCSTHFGTVGECRHEAERMAYATNAARCAAAGEAAGGVGVVCPDASYSVTGATDPRGCGYGTDRNVRHWTSAACTLMAQVDTTLTPTLFRPQR